IEGAIVAGNDIRNFAGTAAIYGIPNALITDNDALRNNVLYALAVAHGETVTNNRVEWNQQMGIVVDAFANVNQPVAKDWLVADNGRNNAGWNPRGAITAPAVPASGVGVTNDSGYDVTAYVYAGVVTQLQLGLAPPVTGALTTASTGGTLAGATTYYYRVTAL